MVDVEHRATVTPVELEKWRSQYPAGAILGCDYASPSLARRLQAAGIDYADGAGNAHISRPGLHVHVEGLRDIVLGGGLALAHYAGSLRPDTTIV